MKKSIKIIIICLIILALVIGIVLGIKYIGESANKINEEYEKDKEKLQTNYDDFSNYITEYNAVREDLSILLEDSMYYEDFPKSSESLHSFYVSYDELINKIMKSVSGMDTACKREYMEEEYNLMCDSYQLTYEKMINVFLDDIVAYNNLIKSYNEWAGEEKYQLFTSQYVTDYIDYNNDNIYDGKVEN